MYAAIAIGSISSKPKRWFWYQSKTYFAARAYAIQGITIPDVAALGQAAPRLYTHAVRLAGDRPGDAVKPRALRPGSALFG